MYVKKEEILFSLSLSHGGAICAPREFLIRSLFQRTISLIDSYNPPPPTPALTIIYGIAIYFPTFHVFASRSRSISISNKHSHLPLFADKMLAVFRDDERTIRFLRIKERRGKKSFWNSTHTGLGGRSEC